jgi:hypothetical protein
VLVNDEPGEKESEEKKEEEPGFNSCQLHKMRQLSGIWPTSAAAKLADSDGTRTMCFMTSGLADATPPDDAFENADAAIEMLFDDADFGYNYAMFVQDPAVEAKEPKNYAHAWKYPDKVHRAKWCDAITKEFLNMEKRKVWKKIHARTFLPEGVVLNTNGVEHQEKWCVLCVLGGMWLQSSRWNQLRQKLCTGYK